MNELKKQFGRRIKELRERSNISQEKLAEMVGMDSRHISRIETGNSFTTIENLYKISKALNVEMSTIFEFEHKKNPENLKKEIINTIKKSNDENIELIFKIIKSILK